MNSNSHVSYRCIDDVPMGVSCNHVMNIDVFEFLNVNTMMMTICRTLQLFSFNGNIAVSVILS